MRLIRIGRMGDPAPCTVYIENGNDSVSISYESYAAVCKTLNINPLPDITTQSKWYIINDNFFTPSYVCEWISQDKKYYPLSTLKINVNDAIAVINNYEKFGRQGNLLQDKEFYPFDKNAALALASNDGNRCLPKCTIL